MFGWFAFVIVSPGELHPFGYRLQPIILSNLICQALRLGPALWI